MIPAEALAFLKAACDAASKGPVLASPLSTRSRFWQVAQTGPGAMNIGTFAAEANAKFWVVAREWLPTLIEELERLYASPAEAEDPAEPRPKRGKVADAR